MSIPWWKRHNKSRWQGETSKNSIWMKTLDYFTSQASHYYTDTQRIPQPWTRCGVWYILSNIRGTYWILKERLKIKQVGRRCILCQRKSKKNIQAKMRDIPFARLEPMKPPFSSDGIDLFRPIMMGSSLQLF